MILTDTEIKRVYKLGCLEERISFLTEIKRVYKLGCLEERTPLLKLNASINLVV